MQAGNGKVILILDEEEEMTKGGIIIPEKDRKESQVGTVVDVCQTWMTNQGSFRMPQVGLEKGARVAIGRFSGIDLEVDHQKYVIVNIDDVLAILQPAEVASAQPA